MKYLVTKEIFIKAPVKTVFSKIVDLKEWENWSPWIKMDPGMKNNYSKVTDEVGASQEWKGEITGTGKQEIAKIEGHKNIEFRTEFVSPFKSISFPRFELHDQDQGTLVKWHMEAALPWFMFPLVGMMKMFIGRDFERGLKMLKEYVETGEVLSETKYEGIVTLDGQPYVGIRTKTHMSEIGSKMNHDFDALMKYVSTHKLKTTGVPFALYHVFDMAKGKVEYTAGIAVTNDHHPEAPFYVGNYATTKALKVLHTGSYHNLDTSWAAAMSWFRTNKLKKSKPGVAFEFYLDNPSTTPVKKMRTEILIGTR